MADETPETTPEDATPAESAETEQTPATEEVAAEAPVEAPAEAVDDAAAQLTLGTGDVATEEEAAVAVAPVIRGRVDKFGVAMGTGRRKTAVARVRVKEGDGKLTINGRSLEEFFCVERDRQMVTAPLRATEQLGKVDVWVRVNGGGTTGQTGAIVLGVARALQVMDPDLHHALADGGFLTRDGRMVERKKYGYKKARKSFQFSKR